MNSEMTQERMAGRIKQMRIMPIQSIAPGARAASPIFTAASEGFSQPVTTPMGPTIPEVPMPEEMGAPFMRRLNRQVAMGPVIAAVNVGGTQRMGFFSRLGTSSIEVPRPMEASPLSLFSRYEQTAKPTICAQHPATAAPPARPTRPRPAQMAAELMGRVRIIPTMTDTRMPIRKGC